MSKFGAKNTRLILADIAFDLGLKEEAKAYLEKFVEKMECYLCEKDFTYFDEDAVQSCDVRDGEYMTFDTVRCPYCKTAIEI